MCKHKTGEYYVSAHYKTEEGFWREIDGTYTPSFHSELEGRGVEDVFLLFACHLCDHIVEAEMPLDKVALWVQTHEEERACL